MTPKRTIPGITPDKLPQHVAIIMDGNGRWAKRRGLPRQTRTTGHSEGVNSVNRITRYASDLGIKHLTLYAFSTENWNRPAEEVDVLMHLIGETILREAPELRDNNVHINLLGDIDRLPEPVRLNLFEGRDLTAQCDGLNLNLCLSYSSRWEITDAARRIAALAAAGQLNPDDITDDTVARNLATAFMPDPDLLIRTGGDMRVSNFLLWQIAYAEIYVTDTYWPDFQPSDLRLAISDFQRRQRRFGLTGEQVK